jgi:hypothetical protein
MLTSTLVLACAGARADDTESVPTLNLAIMPALFKSEFVTAESEEIKTAKLNSGLGVALAYGDVQVAVNYNLQGLLKADQTMLGEDNLSQLLKASVRSKALDQALGVKANFSADSMVKSGGDIYRYRVTPGFSKSLADLAALNFKYEYQLNKPSAQAIEQEKRGYALGLKGSARQGRVNWSSAYTATSEYRDRVLLTKSTEVLGFKSSIVIVPQMKLELSSAIKQQTIFKGSTDDASIEKRYGAALAWSPSESYSLALKLNKLEQSRQEREEYFGSGSVSWFPKPNLEFSLDYGDQLVEGARGLMITTRLDLGPSF